MGTWLRSFGGRRSFLRHLVNIQELSQEYISLKQNCRKGYIPDPWDDYPRSDLNHRSWKRHRKTQYKIKKPKLPKPKRAKVSYDSPWHYPARWIKVYGDFDYRTYTSEVVGHEFRINTKHLPKRYRVREAYRRYRVDK